jgi:hypothetical protein
MLKWIPEGYIIPLLPLSLPNVGLTIYNLFKMSHKGQIMRFVQK